MIKEEYQGARQWSRDRQAIAIVGWISFLVAAISTMVFFALFDPIDLISMLDSDFELSRDTGYALGFFFFWVIALVCSGVTAFLVRTAPKRDQQHR
jgi:TRAP-type mannitol/chloroaromatic compound transport system permease small subunit